MKKTLVTLLAIVSVSISYNYIESETSATQQFQIELAQVSNQSENNIIHVDQLKQVLARAYSLVPYKKKDPFLYRIQTQNALAHLNFHTQNFEVLPYKSLRLQVVINEISMQNSHRI